MRSLRLLVALCALPCVGAGAQATVHVSPLDPVYRSIDRLVANGLVDQLIVGQRPYTRSVIARTIVAATQRLVRLREATTGSPIGSVDATADHGRLTSLEQLVAALRADYADEVAKLEDTTLARTRWDFAPLRRIVADLTTSSGSARNVPASNGNLGSIDAFLAPLLANRQGRPLVEGTNLSVEADQSLEGPSLAIGATPGIASAWDTQRARTLTRGSLQTAEIRLLLRNVAIDVGRQYVTWGQGRDVGLLGSTNSPPLDLVKISNERVFRLPFVLQRLGPTQLSLFYADLGREQNYPGAYFVGYKMSIAPSPRLELGATVYSKSGGHGAPRASFSSRVVDVFPFLQAAFYNNLIGTRSKGEFSDRYAGFDGRIRIPSARGLEIYAEMLLNDFDVRRLESVFWEDAGHVVGLTIPRLGKAQDVSVTAEMHHTGIRYYEHTQFTTGQTLRRTLIGDPLGPDAAGGYAFVDWQASARRTLTLAVAGERRSNDQYRGVALPNGSLRFERIESRPKEMRYRAVATWSASSPAPGLTILTQLGYERTRHFNFDPSLDRNGFLARLGVAYRPR